MFLNPRLLRRLHAHDTRLSQQAVFFGPSGFLVLALGGALAGCERSVGENLRSDAGSQSTSAVNRPDGGGETELPPPPAQRDDGGSDADAAPVTRPTSDPPADGGVPQPQGPEAPPVSQICGDQIRDPLTEACDDGAANQVCTPFCKLTTQRVSGGFRLGTGRHAATGGEQGFALIGRLPPTPPGTKAELAVHQFDAVGRATRQVVVAEDPARSGSTAAVAMLPGGGAAVVWNAINPDGDHLDVVLRGVSSDGVPSPLKGAASLNQYAQYGADAIWAGSELVVAWADDSQAATAPDLRFRRFDKDLNPLGGQTPLAASESAEGQVSLTSFGQGWAAAWRAALPDATEEVQVSFSGGSPIGLGANLPAAASESPAMLPLGEHHLLVVFAAFGPAEMSPFAHTQYLRFAVLEVGAAPGVVASGAVPTPDASGVQDPQLVGIDDRIVLTWRSFGSTGRPWAQLLRFDEQHNALEFSDPLEHKPENEPIPSGGLFPRFAVGTSPLLSGSGAFFTAWQEAAPAQSAQPEVFVRVEPWPPPVTALPSCEAAPCPSGTGPCETHTDCETGLSCLGDVAGQFRYHPALLLCAEAHCGTGQQDGDETDVDCGGSCGKCWGCPPKSLASTDDYCSALCPCGLGRGDCDTDAQCEPGLVCTQDPNAPAHLLDREFCMAP